MLNDQSDRQDLEKVMAFIYKENPKHWPHGLSLGHFDEARCIRDGGRLAGFLGWQVYDKPYGKLGIYSIGIYPWFRGKGLAKRALRDYLNEMKKGVDHVGALIVEGNTASEKLADALGIQVARTVSAFSFTKPDKVASVAPMQKSANTGAAAAALIKQLLIRGGLAGGAYGFSKWENDRMGYGDGVGLINTIANVSSALGVPGAYKNKTMPSELGKFTAKQIGVLGADKAQKLVETYAADAPMRKTIADTNLEQSKNDLTRAKLDVSNSEQDQEMKKKFLMAGLAVGVPALGIYAWNSLKPKGGKPKSNVTGSREAAGDPGVNRRKSKIRIDVPYSALPEGFIEGLANADDRPFARTKNIEVPA